MQYPLYEFKRKENAESSDIIFLVENAREKLYDLSKTLYTLTKDYNEVFRGPISDSLKNLAELANTTNDSLLSPKFTMSTLGTTSSGKSTFVNGLIGAKLAPMDKDELSAGTLRFKFNSEMKTQAKLEISTLIPNNFWQNGNFLDSYENIYKKSYETMSIFRKESREQTLSIPQLTIESAFFVGSKPNFLGLDSHARIEILDLPGLKTISDSNNLRVIQDNIRSSFIVFLMDYENLFDEQKREILYNELIDIKKSIGNTVTMLFVLNKVDTRNQDDADIELALEKCKGEIREKLNLNEDPEVIQFNSLLLYYMQSALLGYINSGTVDNEELEIAPIYKETVLSNLNKCFDDQARIIRRIKRSNEKNQELIEKIETLMDDSDIPKYEDFIILWNICFEKSGAGNMFNVIRNRTHNHLRELILYPTMNKFLLETETFFNLLNNTIKAGQINDLEQIKKSKNDLKEIEVKLKDKISEAKNLFKNRVEEALPKLQSKIAAERNEGIRILGLGNIQAIITLITRSVQNHTIEPIRRSLKKELDYEQLEKVLVNSHHWIPESVSEIKSNYIYLQKKLYNDERHITNGKSLEFLASDKHENDTVNQINSVLTNISKNIEKAMSHNLVFEMQRSIDNLAEKITNWIESETKKIHINLSNSIFKINPNITLPYIQPEDILKSKYNGAAAKKLSLTVEAMDNTIIQDVLIGTKKISETVIKKEKYERAETYKERPWYYLGLVPVTKTRYVPDVRYKEVTEYRNVPVFEKQEKRVVKFDSVDDLSLKWSNSLLSLENDLWQDVSNSLILLLEDALDSYEEASLVVTKQIKIILDNTEIEINQKEDNLKLKWQNINGLYEKGLEQKNQINQLIVSK